MFITAFILYSYSYLLEIILYYIILYSIIL
jgi:hypothetical protein